MSVAAQLPRHPQAGEPGPLEAPTSSWSSSVRCGGLALDIVDRQKVGLIDINCQVQTKTRFVVDKPGAAAKRRGGEVEARSKQRGRNCGCHDM